MRTSALERFLRYVVIDTRQTTRHRLPEHAGAARTRTAAGDGAECARPCRCDGRRQWLRHRHRSGDCRTRAPRGDRLHRASRYVTGNERHRVRPIVHRRYEGGDIALPDDPSAIIRAADNPELVERTGDDIVTASGTTLLGADDKAGIASIMAAVEQLLADPQITHGPVRVCFTPDEEIGRGADRFDVPGFQCVAAYTLDGGTRGELEYESFSADLATVTFNGFNTHPGYAKGKMVNAIRVAADFIASLPRESLSPETTAGYDGFVHAYDVSASVDRMVVKVLLRDFATARLVERRALIEDLARGAAARHPGCTVEISVREQSATCVRCWTSIPGSSSWRETPCVAWGSNRSSGRSAAAPTAPAFPSWACRRRTSSPVSTTFIRDSNGSRRRTWILPRRSSSSSLASGARLTTPNVQPPTPNLP